MGKLTEHRLFPLFIIFCLGIFSLSGCLGLKGGAEDSKLRRQVQSFTSGLERGLIRENVASVMSLAHSEYKPSRSNLRTILRDLFGRFTEIDLEIYAVNFNRADGEVNLEASWNLRWLDTANDELVRRSGRTNFRLRPNENGRLRLISHSGDNLLRAPTGAAEKYRQ